MMEDPKSRFHERDAYGYDSTGLLYHVNKENGKEYKATIVPKVLIKTVLQEMHDHFGHFGIGKTCSLTKRYYSWPKMISHIQAHVDSCSLSRREKMQAKNTNFRQLRYLRVFTKGSIDLIVEMPASHYGNRNILVIVNHFIS